MRSAIVLILLAIAGDGLMAQPGCGVARDLVVQSIENLKGGAKVSDVQDGIQLLKQAVQGCPTLGDAYYYRSLFEDRLGNKKLAQIALDQADLNDSAAMKEHLNPFVLAAPDDVKVDLGKLTDKWALVIGISKFRDAANNLKYAAKDAQDLSDFLQDPKRGRFQPDHVKAITGKEASLAGVKAGLNWLARKAQPSDLVLVFIASHGTPRSKDTVGQLNYILTNDSNTADDDTLYGSSLPMVEVSEVIRSRIPARRTVVILDTCHSEGATRGLVRPVNASNLTLDELKAGFGRAILTSSKQDQSSYEDDSLENGIFTHFLIEGLSQNEGRVSLTNAFEYLVQHVEKKAKSVNKEQTPVMVRSNERTEIVIGEVTPGAPPS